jgi:hypothetical protein
MSETRFRPGPWRVEAENGYFDIVTEYGGWAIVGSEGCEDEANANLIAAAPRLFNAMMALIEECNAFAIAIPPYANS